MVYSDSIKIDFIIQVAWSVARTSFFQSPLGLEVHLLYPVVLVNEGGAWKPSSHKAVIPRDGYYFIHVGGGVHSARRASLFLRVNNKETLGAGYYSSSHNGTDTMSRSGILKLSVGDEIRVHALYPAYSDKQMQTIFIGFLL